MSFAVLGWIGTILVAELVGLLRLQRLLDRFRERSYVTSPQVLRDMPSVSVCIAARNEQHAMSRCLESVLASTYPKMEVLVLDDESVDNTSSLIKAFAQDGVRFIQGDVVPQGWLGRNHALGTLLAESSGTYVLFLSVDTVLSPHSVSQLVAYAESRQSTMVSVLPQRRKAMTPNILLSPFRYFWQMIGHRSSRPVVASNVWMARRKDLQADFADMSSLRDSVEPEVDIARHYFALHSYKFLISRKLLGITYDKKLSSLIETIVRIRYPELKFSVVRTVGSSVLKLLIAVTPLLAFFGGIILIAALSVYVLGACIYRLYLGFAWRYGANVGMWLWPVILLFDAYLTVLSMYRYRRGAVTWKGRRISTIR